MTANLPAPAPVAVQLSEATSVLLSVAANVPALARSMGLELVNEGRNLRYNRNAAWLEKHPLRPAELTFNADRFAATLAACSSGERLCKLWLLNVWNPGYAHSNDWNFDLFAAVRVLDSGNRQAISEWLAHPIFP